MAESIATLYPDWPQYAERLRDGVAGLTAAQLAIRAGPDHGAIWQLAAHCAGTRVYWLCHVFGEPGAETTPFTDPAGLGWEDEPEHPRSGAELAGALDATWAIIAATLDRWTPDDLDVTAERPLGEQPRRDGDGHVASLGWRPWAAAVSSSSSTARHVPHARTERSEYVHEHA